MYAYTRVGIGGKVVLILFISLYFAHGRLLAERPDLTWGTVAEQHLTMAHFPPDTNAAAVVLFDFGECVIADDFYVEYYRHRRIKIFSSDGYNWGSYEITYLAEGRAQRVRDLEGQTINMNNDGTVTVHKLNPDDIFDEDIDGSLRRIRFTLPALQPGSVVEYRFRTVSNSPTFLHDWTFQAGEPVLWSELHAKLPRVLRYVQVIEGTHRLHRSEQSQYRGENYLLDGTHYRWIMKDLPAIRREPFISTTGDYLTKIRFQLASIDVPGMQPIRYLTSWPELVNELAAARNFGRMLSVTRPIRRTANEVVDGITDPLERMKAIYHYIQTCIVWDRRYRVFPSDRLNSILDSKTGNSADITFLLIAMLRAVDIQADPVILSTRSNGRIQNLYPIIRQFNHVITVAAVDDRYYLLDATDQYIPVGMLPFQSMTDTGLLVKRGEAGWITLGSTIETNREVESKLQLKNNGTLTGKLFIEDHGYNAVSRRRYLDNETSEDFLRDILGENHGLVEVDTFFVDHKAEIEEPLLINLEITSSDYAVTAGDYVYLNPWITGRMTENPLSNPERTFPVEMIYPRKSTISVEIILPENFEIVERPRPTVVRLPGNAGIYRRRFERSGNVITMQRQLELRKVTFQPDEYEELRGFFSQIVARDDEQLVLRRLSGEAEGTGWRE